MSKKKNKKIILTVVSAIGLILLAISGFFWWKNSSSNNSSQDKEESSDNKKSLVNKVKTDLSEKIARVKNGSCELDDFCSYWLQDDHILHIIERGEFGSVEKSQKIYPSDIGGTKYQELVSLVRQTKSEHVKWIEQRQKEADQKLTTDSTLFLTYSIAIGLRKTWEFTGKEKGQKFLLVVPKNHPGLTNFSNNPGDHSYRYHRITGTENIPLVPHSNETGFAKIIKPEDQITIKLIEN